MPERSQTPNPVPGAPVQPSNRPIDAEVVSVPLEAGEDQEDMVVVANESTASDDRAGGGEWPDPEAPARGPAPGTAGPPPGEGR